MDTALTVKLPVDRKAPALARRVLDGLNGELEGVRDPVRLLVSEAVTNSVRHAGLREDEKIELEVSAAPNKVRVDVVDHGRGFDPHRRQKAGPDGGFGLMLVGQLADRWGFEPEDSRFWFEIDRRGR
jgi:anti-sigma regulatory factor (Ser/Thr protein kinase)